MLPNPKTVTEAVEPRDTVASIRQNGNRVCILVAELIERVRVLVPKAKFGRLIECAAEFSVTCHRDHSPSTCMPRNSLAPTLVSEITAFPKAPLQALRRVWLVCSATACRDSAGANAPREDRQHSVILTDPNWVGRARTK